jgi:hypothetical protein
VVQVIVAPERVMLLVAISEMTAGTAVGVTVCVAVWVGVAVLGGVAVRVDVAVKVGVLVRTGVGVGVVTGSLVMTAPGGTVDVGVGVALGPGVVVLVAVVVAAPLAARDRDGVSVVVGVVVTVPVGVELICCASLTCGGAVCTLAITSPASVPSSASRSITVRPECHRAGAPVQRGHNYQARWWRKPGGGWRCCGWPATTCG